MQSDGALFQVDQHGVALLGNEVTTGKVTHERLVVRRAPELEDRRGPLASGSLAVVSWYLIARACFCSTVAIAPAL